MGCVAGITATEFPRQSKDVGKPCRVMFFYGPPELDGIIVRYDDVEPWLTIIRLADGRFVLGTECQYRPSIGRSA